MSVGFGFSAGDFISALELVATVVDALRESGESSTQFRTLVDQLETLQTALESVNALEVDGAQQGEVIALQQAAAKCQKTIDTFWEKIKKYQPSLRTGGSGSRVKDGWMKIRWAVCKKEDLSRFKLDLVGHTESIQMLLTTLQMGATRIDDRRNHQRHQTLAGKMQESYFGCMKRISVVIQGVSTGIEQGRQLLDVTANIIQTNVKIFQMVLNIQNIITRVPGQVERQQPVYFVDALCRHMPFHLEFILSANALTSVLQANFKTIGSGARKIEDGEFVIHDEATKMDIDLASPWETCFAPGQHVVMSMVFNTQKTLLPCCPRCNNYDNSERSTLSHTEDIQCQKCNMVYRRSVSVMPQRHQPRGPKLTTVEDGTDHEMLDVVPNNGSKSLKRSRPHDDEEDLALFRRVRMRTEVKTPTADSGDEHTKALSNNDHPNRDLDNELEAKALRKKNKELADALAKALAPPENEKKKPIKFKDAVGRKFNFPFELCATWAGMEELIRQAFLHVEGLGSHVEEGRYDLIGPNGEIIFPRVWETVIEPEWSVSMHMWPMPEPPKHGPGMMPGPEPGHHFRDSNERPRSRHGHHSGILSPPGPPPPRDPPSMVRPYPPKPTNLPSKIDEPQPQTEAEKPETMRRLNPHSRSQLKLDETSKRPAGLINNTDSELFDEVLSTAKIKYPGVSSLELLDFYAASTATATSSTNGGMDWSVDDELARDSTVR